MANSACAGPAAGSAVSAFCRRLPCCDPVYCRSRPAPVPAQTRRPLRLPSPSERRRPRPSAAPLTGLVRMAKALLALDRRNSAPLSPHQPGRAGDSPQRPRSPPRPPVRERLRRSARRPSPVPLQAETGARRHVDRGSSPHRRRRRHDRKRLRRHDRHRRCRARPDRLSGGTLQYEDTTARTLTVGANVTVDTRAEPSSPPRPARRPVTASPSAATWSTQGTIDFSTNADTAGAGITFTGAAQRHAHQLGTLDLRSTNGVTLNKGTSSASTLDFQPGGAITVQGANTAGFLTIANGTFEISGSGAFSNPVFALPAYTIPATGGFWLNDAQRHGRRAERLARRTTAPCGSPPARSTSGPSARMPWAQASGAAFTFEGGTTNVAGRLTSASAFVTYTQSGGTVNVCNVGRLHHGAVLRPHRRHGRRDEDLRRLDQPRPGEHGSARRSTTTRPGRWSTPAGRSTSGTAATATNFVFRVQGQTPNVVVDNTTNNKTLNLSGQLNVWGNLTINPGTTRQRQPGNGADAAPDRADDHEQRRDRHEHDEHRAPSTSRAASRRSAAATRRRTRAPEPFGTPSVRLGTLSVQNAAGVTIDPGVSALNVNRVNAFYGAISNSDKISVGAGDATVLVIQRGATGIAFAGGQLRADADLQHRQRRADRGLLAVAGADDDGPRDPGHADACSGCRSSTRRASRSPAATSRRPESGPARPGSCSARAR